jgi:ABC-type branched-subunit amino acid transport system substrate-binding protein
MKYMNAKKVPQLFVASGGTKFGDPKNFPWTMGFQPNYQSEGRIYAKYILDHFPNSKIAVFWQNDDAGKDQFKGLKDGLGDKANMIIADRSYEVSDPSIDLQIVALHDSGADVFSPGRRQKDRRRRSARSASSAGSQNSFLPTPRPRSLRC